jgi:hypothetical protein
LPERPVVAVAALVALAQHQLVLVTQLAALVFNHLLQGQQLTTPVAVVVAHIAQ